MRRAALFAALLLLAVPARAGVLTSATLSLDFFTFPMLEFVASGAAAGAPSNTQVFLGAGSAFAGTHHGNSPTTAAPPISGWDFVVGTNAAGSFAGATPGSLGGSARFPVGICAEAYGGLCLLDLVVPFGVSATEVHPPAYGISITYYARPWTAGTAVVTLTAPTQFGATLSTRMGSNGLDSLGRGTLVLVSAVNVVTNIAGQIPVFATLTLNFVPDPGVALLLGAAAAALVALRFGHNRL